MKLLGSLKELVKLVFRTSGGKEVEVQPAEQTAAGPVTIEIPDVGASGADTVVMESAGATLSNKTIDNSNTIDAEAIADGSVTDAEFQYLAGVTSDIQTQIDGKEPTITTLPVSQGGTGSSSALTNDKAMISSGDAIVESSVTSTELGYLSGVSSSVQTQLDGKAENGANSDITSLSGLTTALSISQGGTGETTANDALNAFLPSQSGNLNKFLKTDGTNVEWAAAGGGSGINYLSDIFGADVSPTTTSVAAISTTNTDYSNFLVSSAGGTLSQDTASSVRGANSYKFVPTASGEFFGLPAFQLAEVDLGKALSIKFDLKNDGVANDFDVVVCRYNSSGVHQETISVAGTASSGTPASAQLPTGLTSFRGFFITGSDATDYYRLFVRHLTSATDAVYLDTLVVGPEAVMEGAIVTDWESYNLTIGATTTAPTPGTILVNEARWRRVGDSMEIYYSLRTSTNGTAGNGTYLFPLPAGYTVDATKMSPAGTGTAGSISVAGPAAVERNSGLPIEYTGVAILYDSSNIAIEVGANSISTQLVSSATFALDAPSKYTFKAVVPISEWQSNTQMAARAVEEYAATSGTWDGNSSTTVYGPAGVQMGGSLTTNREKTITFQSPILSTDKMFVEISQDGVVWYDANGFLDTSGNPVINSYSSAGTGSTSSGVFLRKITGSSNQVGVFFFRYAALANDDSPVINWQSTWYWRVRKVSGGAAVGFPVSARNVIGDTSGTAVPAGYVGEQLAETWSGLTIGTTDTTLATHSSVNPGIYLFIVETDCAKGSSTRITSGFGGTATYSVTYASLGGDYNLLVGGNAGLYATYYAKVTSAGTVTFFSRSISATATSSRGSFSIVRIA